MELYKMSIHVDENSAQIEKKHISFKHLGKYLLEESYRAVTHKNMKALYLNNLVEPTLEQIKGCSIYKHPKVTVPRDKFNSLKSTHDVSLTRNVESADYQIISKKFLFAFMDTALAKVSAENFMHLFDNNKVYFSWKAINKIKNYYDELVEKHGEDFCISIYFKANSKALVYDSRKKFISHVNNFRSSLIAVYVPREKVNDYCNLINCNNLVSDLYLNSLCESQLHVFDDNEIDTMINLMNTDDIENHEIVLNSISNCNIKESFDKVAFIFYYYNSELRKCSSWNSVNVKTMRHVMKSFNNFNDCFSGAYYTRYLKILRQYKNDTNWSERMSAKMLVEKGFKYFGINDSVFKINPKDIQVIKEEEGKYMF